LWAKVLAPDGTIKMKSPEKAQWMPVDYQPTVDGNVILYQRAGDLVAKVLKQGEQPGPDEKRRFAHHKTCPKASEFRGPRKGRGGRGAVARRGG